MGSGKPTYLVILKDVKCGQNSLDFQKVNLPQERIKRYNIFDEGFAKLALYIEKPTRANNAAYVKQAQQNYEWLVSDIKALVSQGQNLLNDCK